MEKSTTYVPSTSDGSLFGDVKRVKPVKVKCVVCGKPEKIHTLKGTLNTIASNICSVMQACGDCLMGGRI